jgi:hypothetical protein
VGSFERRDFLLLRVAADREIELSCEQLYMRFVDARVDGSVPRLFSTLADDLSLVTGVRLVDRSWLASADLKRELDAVLVPFRARGGRVLTASG